MGNGLVPRGRAARARGILAAGAIAAAVTLTAAAGAQAAPGRGAIARTKPTWLNHARDLGAAPQSAPVDARVYLQPNGGLAALEQAAQAVSTPGSADFGQFVTPAQYYARFGTSAATVSQVEKWLTTSGFTVTGVESHNRYLEVSGTVAAAEKAFGAQIKRYSHDGLNVQAPSDQLTAPANVAPSVLTVLGVDTTPSIVRPAAGGPAPPSAGFRNAPPLSAYSGQTLATNEPPFGGATLPYAIRGYTGSQFRPAYEGSTSLDGSGVTVAITDAYASPTIASDAGTYASKNGDRAYRAGQLTQSLPKQFDRYKTCSASGWYGEETLDVEAVHAMAQGANIRFYAAKDCFDSGFLDAFARVNDDDVAKIVTDSWGDAGEAVSASTIAAYEQAFAQGAMEGISYLFSSGDSGDEVANTGVKQPDFPASDPNVTAVGGTATAIGASNTLMWETGWGTDKYVLSSDGKSWVPASPLFLYGSGGGASSVFSQPSYQAGIAPNNGSRDVPDVAMDADPTTGMLVGQTQTFPDGTYYDQYRIGGTSLASPLFAGITALAFQRAGGGVGYLNPTIYGDAKKGVFTDVSGPGKDAGNVRVDYINGVDASSGTTVSVRTFDDDSSLTVGPGWDYVTGLGSANSGWLTAIPKTH